MGERLLGSTSRRRAAMSASVSAFTAATLLMLAIGVTGTAHAATSGSHEHAQASTGTDPQTECDASTLRPAPLALAARDALAAVGEETGLTRSAVTALADDPAVQVDGCNNVLYTEDGHVADHETTHTADPVQVRTTGAAPADIFSLASRPGAPRTIYLDLDGDTRTGGWGSLNGPIVSPPFSINTPADTNFDTEEREAIYNLWREVVEDFAPFDVNVTTRDPGNDAITRVSEEDTTFGVHVVVTPRNVISDDCFCSGKGYLGIFSGITDDVAWNERYRTTFSFSELGRVVSHEVGHNLGLIHDGTPAYEYYGGSNGWGSIMGADFVSRVQHWSKGEYAQANNQQDDLAIIATHLPLLSDDHADTVNGATRLVAGQPLTGVIATRADRDAFTFTASGETLLSVTGETGYSNLDVAVVVLNANGQQIAAVNPTRPAFDDERALHANWSVALPAAPATYTAIIDGVGYGNPVVGGQYSDYDSLGRYTVTLSTALPPQPRLALTAISTTVPTDQWVYGVKVVDITGGYAPYRFVATNLPDGVDLDTDTGHLFGQPLAAGQATATITVIDARDTLVSTTLTVNAIDVPAMRVVSQVQQVQGVVGAPLDLTLLTISGGEGPYTFSVASLPAGLSFDTSTGRLYGTPTYPGSTGLSVSVSDTRQRFASVAPIPINVTTKPVPPPPTNPNDPDGPGGDDDSDGVAPKFLTTTLAAARVNKSYRQVLRTSGATKAMLSTRGALPRGITVTKKGSRVIVSGRAKKAGTYKIRLTLTASTGKVTRTFMLKVRR